MLRGYLKKERFKSSPGYLDLAYHPP